MPTPPPALSDFRRFGFRPLPMAFFGRGCIAWLSARDLIDAHFFFRHHLGIAPGAADCNIVLHATGGFFRSLLAKDQRTKSLLVFGADAETPCFSRRFRAWSDSPSPLPPFFHRDFRTALQVGPGTIVLPPGSETGWHITGANYVGKTSLALLLMRRNFALVSDHLVIREKATQWCHGYHSPMGLRRDNFLLFKHYSVGRQIDHRITVSEVTGPVALVHAEDIGGRRAGGCRIGVRVNIDRTASADAVEMDVDPSRTELRLRVHPRASSSDIIAAMTDRGFVDA